MSVQLCIDEDSSGIADNSYSIRGWLLADYPIESIVAQTESGDLVGVAYGHKRPDVYKAHPQSLVGESCGFFVQLTDVQPDQKLIFWINDKEDVWHRIDLAVASREPQTLGREPAIFENPVPYQITEFNQLGERDSIEDNVKSWLERAPRLRLRIDLINRCNLRCVMCHYNNPAYTSKPRKIVTLEDFIAFFEPVGNYVHEALLSCADEPLLAPSFIDVLYYLAENFPHVTMSFCTNAMLFDAKVQKAVIETGVSRVMASFDGVVPETFESIRKGAKYKRVLGNLVNFSRLKKAANVGWPELQMNFVMIRSNIHEGPAFVEAAGRLGAGSMDFHHAVPTCGIDMGEEKLENHPDLFNHYRREILQAAYRLNIKSFMPDELPGDNSEFTAEEIPVDFGPFDQVFEEHKLDMPELNNPKSPAGEHSYGIGENYPDLFCELPFTELYVVDQEIVRPCPYQQRVAVPLANYPDLMSIYFGKEFSELREAMFTEEGDPGCENCPLKKGQLTIVPTEEELATP